MTQIDGFVEPQRAPIVRRGEREPINFLVRQLVYRRDALIVYCGTRSHVSWTIKAAQIL